jgi:hypothetical protein
MRALVAGFAAGMAGVVLFGTAALGASAVKLAPNDIKATFFNGKPFIASTTANVRFKMTCTPEGKMKREPASGGGSRGEGTWKLSKDGFCSSWNGAKESCYTVAAAGDNKWSVMRGSTIMATWSK